MVIEIFNNNNNKLNKYIIVIVVVNVSRTPNMRLNASQQPYSYFFDYSKVDILEYNNFTEDWLTSGKNEWRSSLH